MNKQLKIYLAVLFAMIFWSVSFIWTRVAIRSFQPMMLITLRLLIASLLLFAFLKASGKLQRIKRKDLRWFVLLAFFEPFMYYIGETYGLTMVESTLAAVIVSTIPLFAPVMAFIFLREKMSLPNFLGIIVSLVGVLVVVYDPQGGMNANPWGVALMFFAVFSSISYTTVLRKISTEYTTINVIFYQSLIGLGFFFPTFLITDSDKIASMHISSEAIMALILLAVFASVIAFVLFAGVVREIGVAKTNVFVNLIPVFTALFAWLFLGESITFSKMVGIFVVVAGLFVSQMEGMKSNLKQIRGPEY